MDFYSFYTGGEYEAYKYLGVHRNGSAWVFRTFAPQAASVELLHNGNVLPMNPVYDGNFYEAVVENVMEGDCYEYRIHGGNGKTADHMDPYGYGVEVRPAHKSVIRTICDYEFRDSRWMKSRGNMLDKPLNIYEVHVGSWKKPGKKPDDWYRYDELAQMLIPYIKDNSYNYVEFMPICEYPADESWGYQSTGYFAPTSRYGSPSDQMRAVDMFHQNNIGVILDFVPAHFANDDYGLRLYDGTSLFEYPHDDVGISEWGSCNFMHSRGEVKSFLKSSVNYWLSEYHFDGIRMDAVSRILYWQGDEKRGVNTSAVDFLKSMNEGLKERNKGIMLIAEDSTNYPKVTRPVDEVVHGKASILQKMSGEYDDKFPQAKALYMYMMIHPGKKLNFMGNEFGQIREWDEKMEQDWMLLKYPAHDSFHHYIMKLNELYLKNDAFWEADYDSDGFVWLDCNSKSKCLYSIMRNGENCSIAAMFNFGENDQIGYRITLPRSMKAEVHLYSDWEQYGGQTYEGSENVKVRGCNIVVDLRRFSGIILRLR